MEKCKETTYNQFVSEINSRLEKTQFKGRPVDALEATKEAINDLLRPYGLCTGAHWADYNVTMTPENPFRRLYGIYSPRVFRLKVCGEQDEQYRNQTRMLEGAHFALEAVHEPTSIGFDPAKGSMLNYYKSISRITINERIDLAKSAIDELRAELSEAKANAADLNEKLSKVEEL